MDEPAGERAGVSEEQRRAAAERIDAARDGSERLVESLTRLWDGVVEASAMTNIDDEHDPEGATVAFERAQLRDALKQARADLDDLDRAAERVRTGDYWVCERCGGPIPTPRLDARPTATTCVVCAEHGSG
jgi:DnaK suppressor protein